ncbi:hypothetical protein KJ359_001203 [Pestalotiopsis sp. 9143b]|nr:hypothetical protein KJ359_001203 [Pestalotiopsis sp. 9143b]
MKTAKAQEGEQSKDNLKKAENDNEQSHDESNSKNQDDNQGTSSSVDVKNHPAFKNAWKAIATFNRGADKLIRDHEDFEMNWGQPSVVCVEGSLDEMDDLHKKALTVVREAISVDKEEGDKFKAKLQENWKNLRFYFAEPILEWESHPFMHYSDPELDPYSPVTDEGVE